MNKGSLTGTLNPLTPPVTLGTLMTTTRVIRMSARLASAIQWLSSRRKIRATTWASSAPAPRRRQQEQRVEAGLQHQPSADEAADGGIGHGGEAEDAGRQHDVGAESEEGVDDRERDRALITPPEITERLHGQAREKPALPNRPRGRSSRKLRSSAYVMPSRSPEERYCDVITSSMPRPTPAIAVPRTSS